MAEVNRSRRSLILDKVCIIFGELTATAFLIYLGCMGCVQTTVIVNSHVQIAISFGFVVLICIQCFGCVSGAHLNPAVTLASYVYRQISWPMALGFFVAQMLGAFIGYGLLKASLPDNFICSTITPQGACLTTVASGVALWQAVLIEFLITCVLITICCGVWDPRNAKFQDSVPIRFGLAIACLSLIAGQFTGASMNPARSFAPAVWNNAWENHWVYWVSPLAAALVTSLVYKHVFRRQVNDAQKSFDRNESLS
ncbi:aquaporin isoform X2 [Drosophila virilis]|uniref:Uncharacterized protein, isoform B n=1 Tax=Drosophila virilis TaxID=7244 RepID=A0A0Q9W5S5_DROVI|nr:aquaporin isoform X2 [Drosophila virilis]KRF80380.1 uncharacterized protein Dvir_GJ22359, isoform B [Drosophila virilis]